jgi:hypothetical protein
VSKNQAIELWSPTRALIMQAENKRRQKTKLLKFLFLVVFVVVIDNDSTSEKMTVTLRLFAREYI